MKVQDKRKPVIVFNVITGKKLTYLIPPKKAIVAAWFQYETNNWNKDTYENKERPLIITNKDTYSCGDWHTRR